MRNTKIKICDIRDIQTAQYCEKQGIDFLGIHQIKYPLTEEKRDLVNEIKARVYNTKTVLVTYENKLDKLLEMCLACDWDYIQLHFTIKPEDVVSLRNDLLRNFSKAGIISVIDTSNLTEYSIEKLSNVSDLILFDSSIRGGTGIPSKEEDLKRATEIAKDKKFFIAGGLNPNNVADFIRNYKPYAVDVQSGVEFSNIGIKHKKDPERIKSFINAVEMCDKSNIQKANDKREDR